MPGLRVVPDTNVLVSGLAYPGSVPGRIVTAWQQGSLEFVLSRYILDELVRVLVSGCISSAAFKPPGIPDGGVANPRHGTAMSAVCALPSGRRTAFGAHANLCNQTLPRLPRIRMTAEEIRDLADSFMFLADMVEPDGTKDANLRDPADQPVLLTLTAAQADYLVTGDKDLLALADQYPILTPAQFWMRHGV